jgi:thiol-disulfide isomerase/thioredoxin
MNGAISACRSRGRTTFSFKLMRYALCLGWLFAFTLLPCAPTAAAAEDTRGGVGLMLGTDTQTQSLRVLRVFPETPAAKAGLKPGMLLKSIDGSSTSGKSLSNAVELIRGPVGSTVRLELQDPKSGETKQVEVKRQLIATPAKARLGEEAAPLSIKEWIQGGPVDVKDGKMVYVVEFWATWCGPCRVSIPHLSALQKRLKDRVVVVGISNEDPATVKPFVKKMGAQMDYVVACDDSAQTNAGYMAAYGFNGIPTAFVVDKEGRVLWAGHPMGGLDKALEQILVGKEKL